MSAIPLKLVVVVLDGASGESVPELSGNTSLQAANCLYLDNLVSQGQLQLVQNVPEGLEASSNIACTSIVGYNPVDYPIGRGALEAAAVGIELSDDEIAFRLNLVNLSHSDNGDIMHSYSAGNLNTHDAHKLVAELKSHLDDATFTLHPGAGFRSYLVVKGRKELLNGSYFAAHNITGLPLNQHLPSGAGTEIITEYMHKAQHILQRSQHNSELVKRGELPANGAMVFWPGTKPAGMPSFQSVYGDIALHGAVMTSGVDLLVGIAKLTDIAVQDVPGVTDDFATDYIAQGQATINLLKDYDVVFCHIEAPDAAGHDGNVSEKVHAIEQIDQHIIQPLYELGTQLNNDETAPYHLRVLALPDHSTPLNTGKHSRDPVPAVLWGWGARPNGAVEYNEMSAKSTGLYLADGYKLLGEALQEN